MKTMKQLLIIICLMAGLIQAPVAQAQAVEQVVSQLASRLIPMLIPVAISGAVMAVRVVPLIPAYVREMPRPHLPGRGKKTAPEGTQEQAEGETVSTDVSGTVTNEDGTPIKKPAGTEGAAEGDAGQAATEAQQPQGEVAQAEVMQPKRQKADDNSDWYLED